MFKKLLLSLSFLLPLSLTPVFAEWESFDITEQDDTRKTIRAVWKDPESEERVTLESVSDVEEYKNCLRELAFKEGYPAEEGAEGRFKAQNINRQKDGNLYHLLRMTYQNENEPSKIGLVQLGRMPSKTKDYDQDHLLKDGQILQKFISLGVTRKIEGDGYNDSNIERIEKRGIGFFLPMFEQNAQENGKLAALSVFPHFFQYCKDKEFVLPVEETLPHVIMGLFHPDDQNLEFCQVAGFDFDDNPGYGWFYPSKEMLDEDKFRLVPRPRVIVTKFL